MRTRTQREITVYSSQDRSVRLFSVSHSDAIAMVESGEARILRGDRKESPAIQLRELNRATETSPSGLPASTMSAAAAGARWARRKVRTWGVVQAENFNALVVSA